MQCVKKYGTASSEAVRSHHKTGASELFGDFVHRTNYIFRNLRTGADHFTGSEEENDHFWFIESVNKTGELFGFVLDFLQT